VQFGTASIDINTNRELFDDAPSQPFAIMYELLQDSQARQILSNAWKDEALHCFSMYSPSLQTSHFLQTRPALPGPVHVDINSPSAHVAQDTHTQGELPPPVAYVPFPHLHGSHSCSGEAPVPSHTFLPVKRGWQIVHGLHVRSDPSTPVPSHPTIYSLTRHAVHA
jgi:hypothetical protein